ncbi:hypothetical protein HanXRQr2_Chr13g0595841 [Helianthus annuus]|uniref:Uncharacterized protein n=1 Tax=Helianthus annuus TaxID=4232 RepID=A0A9K3EJ39_HELAN|nr:hypothetical protein HanXRQr2_Chr13g0595841 [Helianthus annuus]
MLFFCSCGHNPAFTSIEVGFFVICVLTFFNLEFVGRQRINGLCSGSSIMCLFFSKTHDGNYTWETATDRCTQDKWHCISETA